MTRKERNARRNSRVELQDDPRNIVAVKGSHPYKNPPVPKLEPMNDRQRTAMCLLREGRPLVFLRGTAGTGKSMIAAHHAATLINQKLVDKIVLVRPAVAAGRTIGMLPGSSDEKLYPYFAQTIAHLKKFLGEGHVKYLLDKKQIEMFPVEYMRGMSFENTIVIFEETQNFTHEEFEMVLTRLGENTQFIFTGDERQTDLKGKSGLTTTVNMLQHTIETEPDYLSDEDLDFLAEGVGVVTFGPEDCVRSGLTRAFVKMYYHQ